MVLCWFSVGSLSVLCWFCWFSVGRHADYRWQDTQILFSGAIRATSHIGLFFVCGGPFIYVLLRVSEWANRKTFPSKMAEGRRVRKKQGYLVTVSHPTSDTLQGWDGPIPQIGHMLRAEVYSHLVRCYNEVQKLAKSVRGQKYPKGGKRRTN